MDNNYYNNDSYDDYDDGDEILGEFLIDEPPDIDIILMPKFDFDLKQIFEKYYNSLKKCRNKEQIMQVLESFYSYISKAVLLQHEISCLQTRVKELEYNIKLLELDRD
jgi:hypothetical protein